MACGGSEPATSPGASWVDRRATPDPPAVQARHAFHHGNPTHTCPDIMRKILAVALALITSLPVGAQTPVATWATQHQREIVDEFSTLLAIPNVARNDADMRRNAELLKAMFEN